MPTNHANQPTTGPTSAQWAAHIRSLILRPLADVPFDGTARERRSYAVSFSDEYGNRRSTDRPFLAYLLGISLEPPENPLALDQQLWWMILSGQLDIEKTQSLIEPDGALVQNSDSLAIEYRTMVELCALHALWIIATKSGSATLIDRCLKAAAWHTRELQPDNAINRPWATQVFIALSHKNTDSEVRHLAHLHAQTLIHNTSVSFGVPDKLSALVLKDVADQLAG